MSRRSFSTRSLHTFMAHLLGRSRAASDAQVDRSERRVLQRLRQEPMWISDAPLFDAAPLPIRRFSPVAASAMAAGVVVAIVAAALVVRDVTGRRGIVAVVEAGESSISVSSNAQPRHLQANDRIAFGDIVRSNGGSGGMLRLADGSGVEVRSRSELSLERTDDGVRIRLSYGGIIVNAAKQRDGHLYVQTKDVTVSVVGTVFLVNADEAGSRIAVLEGEVRVQQGATDQKLLPGQQVMTSPEMTAPTLPQEIAWSRNARAHLALLQQSASASARGSGPSVSPAEPGTAFEEATPFGQASAADGSQQSRFVQVDFVVVDAIVVDSAGQPVVDLRESDLQVFENGVQQTIESLDLLESSIEQRPYYLLSYRVPTAPAAASFRRIEVRVDRPGVRVAARAGYRLRAPYADRTLLRDELERLDALAQDGFSRGAHAEGEAGLVVPVPRERRQPSYPSEAIIRRIQGRVVVEAVVDVDGRVSRSRVASSLDNGRFGLDDEALNAVSQWIFTPGELKGQKVPVLMRLVVIFQMH
jgi:TonB family protein